MTSKLQRLQLGLIAPILKKFKLYPDKVIIELYRRKRE